MITKLAAAAIALMLGAAPAMAQDIPAAKGLDVAAKAALAKLIDSAKQEGSLTYADTILQPSTNTLLAKAFRDYYGLPASFQVNYTLLQSGALVTRIEQEIGADKVRFDVASVGSPTWVIEKHKAGQLLEYRSPQYAAFKAAFDAGLGIDGVFAFNGGYAQIPIWNTEILDFKGKSYKEAVAAAVPGRFSVGDVANSESHLTTYAGLRQIFDVPFFKSMAQKKPAFLSRSEQSAQRIVTGQDVIAFGGNPSRVLQNNQKGAKLKILYPEEGFVLLPQATFILKAAPHPNAAKLWLDFVLSEAGQDILARNEALMSGRAGFKSPVPDVAPNFEQLKIIKVDWTAMTADQLRKYRDEWVSIFNP
jgi:iron(III) transport system substrate-binding protein